MPTLTDKQLLKKLSINPGTDAVAVFKPNRGCSFYIPDQLKNIGDNIPSHVLGVLTLVYMMEHLEDDPKVAEFSEYVTKATIAELSKDDHEPGNS